ncbi:MAG: hypothetical protein JRN35_05080 [Nitrososphaerota archaeon]|nr:hypothetical protein [Nitrososphaerota archaeon]
MTDEEVGRVLEMVYSHMVNRFKGDLAEILAIGPVSRFLRDLKEKGVAPPQARYVMGPAILEPEQGRGGWAKGADGLLIADGKRQGGRVSSDSITIYGIVEVKSYHLGKRVGRGQLEMHQARLRGGLRIDKSEYSGSRIILADSRDNSGSVRPYYLFVLPKRRTSVPMRALRRGSWFSILDLPYGRDRIMSAAYEMTLWFFGLLGCEAYKISPIPWKEMTGSEAGRNQIKMALYYIMLRDMHGLAEFKTDPNAWRRRRDRLMRIATRLYNSYGWGLDEAILHKGMLWQETDPRTGNIRFTELPP